MKKEISLDVPFESAPQGDCGLGCVKMILKYKRVKSLSIQELSKKYKDEFYIEEIGWKHDGLIKILNDYELGAYRKSDQSFIQITDSINNNRPVIVSLRVPSMNTISEKGIYINRGNDQEQVGHLCVVVGYDDDNVVIHDPRNIFKYKDFLHVPKNDFLRVFTGRCIYLE